MFHLERSRDLRSFSVLLESEVIRGTFRDSIPSMTTVKEHADYPPPGMEVRLIERHAHLTDRRILEIGCGDGRLTRQLAPLASSVVAIEPDADRIAVARRLLAAEGISNVTFRVASAERLRRGGEPFEVAVFSWSL
jgi:2-polyprenyl-3-methyl-5-hydroxy-6-metoxy-1,4-benzoquinol methylase